MIALNHASPTPPTASLMACNAVLAADGKAPEWIELIPAGVNVVGEDGRKWINDRPDQVLAAFNQDGRSLPLDWEHATEKLAPQGHLSPAAGWIKALQRRDDGSIWGQVDWTPKGAEAVQSREYRFVSPVFFYEPSTRRILRLTSAALTNRPNLPLTALNQAQGETIPESAMNKALLQALGLPETASEADAILAIGKLKTELVSAQNQAQAPSLEKFVPRADHDAAVKRASEAEGKLKTIQDAALNQQVDAEIQAALKDRRITPATAEYHKAMCQQVGGLDRFRAFVKAAPQIAPDSGIAGDPEKKNGALTEDQLAICQKMGLKPEDFQKAMA